MMRRDVLLSAAAAVVLVGACGSSSHASSTHSSASTATTAAQGAPQGALIVADLAWNQADRAANAQMMQAAAAQDVAGFMTGSRQQAQAAGQFESAVSGTTFPSDASADARDLIVALGNLQGIETEAGDAPTLYDAESLADSENSLRVRVNNDMHLLSQDLHLPG